MSVDLAAVLEHYPLETGGTAGEPLGHGHVHETFLVPGPRGESPGYIVQRINDRVFRNVPALMHNIQLVTRRIGEWTSRRTATGTQDVSLTLEPARDGRVFHQDPAGAYWRVFREIAPSVSYDVADSPQILLEAGAAMGRFQAAVSDVQPADLHITIPRFHDLLWRLEQLDQAVAADAAGRLSESARELEFVASRRRQLEDDFLALQESPLPVRITHNDTKLNNVLFDPKGKALCLIDLDTVMPGYVQYDFGDAVRSGCPRTEEDDPNSRNAGINLDYLRALATGYFREARAFLEVSELEHFATSPRLLTFIMGVRFLTDHLHGDVYYRTAYAGHNLVRARNQMALVRSMETHREAMAAILAKSWRGDA